MFRVCMWHGNPQRPQAQLTSMWYYVLIQWYALPPGPGGWGGEGWRFAKLSVVPGHVKSRYYPFCLLWRSKHLTMASSACWQQKGLVQFVFSTWLMLQLVKFSLHAAMLCKCPLSPGGEIGSLTVEDKQLWPPTACGDRDCMHIRMCLFIEVMP